MIDHIDVPADLNRNAPEVVAAGHEHTGQLLINLATASCGLESLGQSDVLDVGCGVRFAMTIINRKIPIRSYSGIDVDQRVVDFLKTNVEPHDPRFSFSHWDVHNAMYNPAGTSMSAFEDLPIVGSFDLIWLFSVFTHLNPQDSLLLLKLMRKKMRPGGKLFFSAFLDEDLEEFDDRIVGMPLLNAYYGRRFMELLLKQSGWKILSIQGQDLSNFVQHQLVCEPA